MKTKRPPVSISDHVAVFRRDHWLCYVCRRPVVFHLALKYLELEVRNGLGDSSVSYWQRNWRRDKAPLVDELGASVDHVEAYSRGGEHGLANFATICARCNARKSAKDRQAFVAELRPWRVKGRHGEPRHWDGLSSTFVHLGRKYTEQLTSTERKWLAALGGGR